MNRDDIIKLTYLVGAKRLQEKNQDTEFLMSQEQLERFAALVAEKEREACARICETEWSTTQEHVHGLALADMIRDRAKP